MMQCAICENLCEIDEDGTGMCGMYTIHNGVIFEKYPDCYLVAVPSEIESMPMLHYYPGNKFLQVCTIGCNFRCSGCVSWILTERSDSIKDALHKMNPEDVITKAQDEGCRGIMFCFNEPAVSFHTFKKIALLARKNNLLVGCATNAYFTEHAFKDLLRHIDFINIGIKGSTDHTYSKFGVSSASPVFRNLKLAIESGVFTEVAAVYVKGFEDEVIETARRIASISRDIPFQLMRFIPFAGADISNEPSIKEAENLCRNLSGILNYVYLFNSPGTDFLNTLCPKCGAVIVRRGFNGPMCAHMSYYNNDGICACGFKLPFSGNFEKESGAQVLGFFGGYKVIHTLESIQTVLAFLGEKNSGIIAGVLQEILRTDFIKGLYENTKEIESYFNTVDHYAALAGRMDKASALRSFAGKYLEIIADKTRNTERPAVYFSLGHPLIAVFGDKFECNLVELAGGRCVNRDIRRDGIPGITIPEETLIELNPDIILLHGEMGYTLNDFYNFFTDNDINLKAVSDKKVYSMHPYKTAGRPDWILGLLHIANIVNPGIFSFNMEDIADEFYMQFMGIKFSQIKQNRSIAYPATVNKDDLYTGSIICHTGTKL